MLNIIKNTEFSVIKKHELALEKNIKEKLKNKENFGTEDLLKRSQNFESKRCDQLKTIQKVVKHFCEIITTKKKFSKNIDEKSEEDFKSFREDMVTLKSLIVQQKKIFSNEISNLQRKTEDLNAELAYFYEKLPTWREHTKSSVESNIVPKKSVSKNQSKQKFLEINNFFDFVHASGGKEGGWKKEDHLLFLKFLMKYQRVDVVAKSINEMLPDISEQDVHDHFQWFVQYQRLLKAKKDVILKWKEEKNNNKRPQRSYTEENQETTEKSKGNTKVARKSLNERLKYWKEQKELELQRQKELEKQKLKEQKEKEEKRKIKQEEIKNIVNQWKSIKQTIEENHRKEKDHLKVEENKNRSRTAKKLIKQFQSMDELRIKKMRELKLKKEQTKEPKRTKSSPLERTNTQRNPRRLLKPTQQWMNRVHDSSEDPTYEKPALEPRTVLKMPKLHIPEWRKTIQ